MIEKQRRKDQREVNRRDKVPILKIYLYIFKLVDGAFSSANSTRAV